MTVFQITANQIISGVCKVIYDEYTTIVEEQPVTSINIYKEKEEYLTLPAVTVYNINYDKTTERFDRFTNVFDIIINYFPTDNVTIINNRVSMNSEAEKIANVIRYINLPAYRKDENGNYVTINLPVRGTNINIQEKEGFMQISVTYTVRTKKINTRESKMDEIDINVNCSNT